jgi:hypothetical protein
MCVCMCENMRLYITIYIYIYTYIYIGLNAPSTYYSRNYLANSLNVKYMRSFFVRGLLLASEGERNPKPYIPRNKPSEIRPIFDLKQKSFGKIFPLHISKYFISHKITNCAVFSTFIT